MTIPNDAFIAGAHRHQRVLFNAFDRRRYSRTIAPQTFMAEWHRRCRKTTVALNLCIREACRFPNGKYGFIAPTQVMARNILWDDPNMLRAYLPNKREMDWKLNEQKMLVTFANGSLLKIGGSDEPDSWRGVDFIGVVCDEFALMKENLWTEILRPVIGGPLPEETMKYQSFRWAMFLYTPKGMNQASIMFDKACCLDEGGSLPDCGEAKMLRANTFASRVIGEKSGIYSQDELKRLKEDQPRAMYDQEINCSRVTSEEMTLITTAMLHALNDHHAHTTKSCTETRKIVSIDPAFGGDICRIMGMVNCEEKEGKRIRDKHLPSEIVAMAKNVAKTIGTMNFICDSIGVGLAVSSGLSADAAGYNVQHFKSSEKAKPGHATLQALQCANRRAEAYMYSAQEVHHFRTGPVKNAELMRQLSIASRYVVQTGSGKLLILPKLKIKELLGCSPDDADCWIMGVWGSKNVQPEVDGQIQTVSAQNYVPDSYRMGI